MPKVGMEPIRRRQLIAATISAIHAHGLADATVSRISSTAGVSSGIVHHYFGDKNALLEATMRSLLADLRAEVARRLARATTPRQRIEAVIEGNFTAAQFAPETVSAWLAFWAQAPHAPGLARLQRINARRLASNLGHAFRALLPADAAQSAAAGLAALIDGLWLRCALTGGEVGTATARRLAGDYLACRLGRAPGQDQERMP